ncbi:hypothetical protein J1N35_001972, partial [Gossypium stocksii]
IDARNPLKRRKKIQIFESKFTYAKFKYERLTLFSFLCGCLGHGDSFCPLRLQYEVQQLKKGWDLMLRAQGRKASIVNSRWLRNDGESCFFGKSQSG